MRLFCFMGAERGIARRSTRLRPARSAGAMAGRPARLRVGRKSQGDLRESGELFAVACDHLAGRES